MEQIDCPAPLPEDLADALLTEMLVPAPYEVPGKKAKKKATGTPKGSPAQGYIGLIVRKLRGALLPRKRGGGRGKFSPPAGGDKKRKAAPGSKKGRTLPPDHSTTATYSDEEWLSRDKPLAKS